MTDALIEQVAVDLARADGVVDPYSPRWRDRPDGLRWHAYIPKARAAIVATLQGAKAPTTQPGWAVINAHIDALIAEIEGGRDATE